MGCRDIGSCPMDSRRQTMSGSVFLAALGLVFGTFAFLGSLRFILRFLELKHQRRASIASDGVQERLERIEIAVESTAVEVERISEAQRFMAKLLSDRGGTPNLAEAP